MSDEPVFGRPAASEARPVEEGGPDSMLDALFRSAQAVLPSLLKAFTPTDRPGWRMVCDARRLVDETVVIDVQTSMRDVPEDVRSVATAAGTLIRALVRVEQFVPLDEGGSWEQVGSVGKALETLKKAYGVDQAWEAVRRFFVRDGELNAVSLALMFAAGHGHNPDLADVT